MTHKEKIEICEQMREYRMKIEGLDIKLRDNKLTTQEFYFISDLRKDLKGAVEKHLSFLEVCGEEDLASLEKGLYTDEPVYEKPSIKQPFIEKYLVPLLFTECALTVFFIYLWETLK
jgi:hypothetical protein